MPSKIAVHKIAISPEQAEMLYGVNRGTLANLRSKKQGPPYLKVNRKVLYRVADFEKWLFANQVKTMEDGEVR